MVGEIAGGGAARDHAEGEPAGVDAQRRRACIGTVVIRQQAERGWQVDAFGHSQQNAEREQLSGAGDQPGRRRDKAPCAEADRDQPAARKAIRDDTGHRRGEGVTPQEQRTDRRQADVGDRKITPQQGKDR